MPRIRARRSDCFWFEPEKLVIVTDKSDPLYDPRVELPVNDKLVANILFEMQGVLEPVIIAKDGERYVVIDGRQRVRATRRANELLIEKGQKPLEVPCIFKRGNSANLFAISVSTNEQRVNDGPLEKASKLKRLLDQGYSISDAASIFGVGVETIKRWEELINLEPEVKQAIIEKEISATKAVKIGKKRRKDQSVKKDGTPRKTGPRTISEIRKCINEGNLSVDSAKALLWVIREVEEL